MFPRWVYSAAVKPPMGLWALQLSTEGPQVSPHLLGPTCISPFQKPELGTLGLQLSHHTAPGQSSFLLKGQKEST